MVKEKSPEIFYKSVKTLIREWAINFFLIENIKGHLSKRLVLIFLLAPIKQRKNSQNEKNKLFIYLCCVLFVLD